MPSPHPRLAAGQAAQELAWVDPEDQRQDDDSHQAKAAGEHTATATAATHRDRKAATAKSAAAALVAAVFDIVASRSVELHDPVPLSEGSFCR